MTSVLLNVQIYMHYHVIKSFFSVSVGLELHIDLQFFITFPAIVQQEWRNSNFINMLKWSIMIKKVISEKIQFYYVNLSSSHQITLVEKSCFSYNEYCCTMLLQISVLKFIIIGALHKFRKKLFQYLRYLKVDFEGRHLWI